MADAALELQLPCHDHAPGLARAALADLSGIDAVRDDAILVASELVTNAVRHSASGAQDEITLRVDTAGESVTICVRDPGRSDAVPHVRAMREPGDGGLGLRLVQRLARRWDSHYDDGRIVWAQLDLLPAAPGLPANVAGG